MSCSTACPSCRRPRWSWWWWMPPTSSATSTTPPRSSSWAIPTLLALNMMDVAENNGHASMLPSSPTNLGVPVVPVVASAGQRRSRAAAADPGLSAAAGGRHSRGSFARCPTLLVKEADGPRRFAGPAFSEKRTAGGAEALLILSDERALASSAGHYPGPHRGGVAAARQRLEAAGVDWRSAAIESRYARDRRDPAGRHHRTGAARAKPSATAGPGPDPQGLGHADFRRGHGADVPEHLHLRRDPDGGCSRTAWAGWAPWSAGHCRPAICTACWWTASSRAWGRWWCFCRRFCCCSCSSVSWRTPATWRGRRSSWTG